MTAPEFLVHAAEGWARLYADSKLVSTGVIIVRSRGRVFAFNLSCPHENAAVRWKAAVHRFECSRHDSRYEPDGTYTSGRATRNMDRFPLRRNGDTVLVDVSRLVQSDMDRAKWEAAALLL
jgi:nitrite reductase/ring-hydroxylating ferredoxin subunit